MVDKNVVETNITKFLDRHGTEGFLKLFWTNYLFELVMYYLQSERRGERDSSFLLFFDYTGRPYSADEIDAFREGIRFRCAESADAIASAMKEQNLLEDLTRKPLDHPEVAKQLATAVDSIVREITRGH